MHDILLPGIHPLPPRLVAKDSSTACESRVTLSMVPARVLCTSEPWFWGQRPH